MSRSFSPTAIGIAAALFAYGVACSEPRCPDGYEKVGNSCLRQDAGQADPEGEGEGEEGEGEGEGEGEPACADRPAIAGALAWFRADCGVDTDGVVVERWRDQSTNAHDLVQSEIARRPTLATACSRRSDGWRTGSR